MRPTALRCMARSNACAPSPTCGASSIRPAKKPSRRPRAADSSRRAGLDVELRVMSKEAVLVERDSPRRGEVRRDPRAFRHLIGESLEPRDLRGEPRHRVGKCEFEPSEHVEYRQVDVRKLPSDEVKPALLVLPDDALEVAEKLRHAFGDEDGRAPQRFHFLF